MISICLCLILPKYRWKDMTWWNFGCSGFASYYEDKSSYPPKVNCFCFCKRCLKRPKIGQIEARNRCFEKDCLPDSTVRNTFVEVDQKPEVLGLNLGLAVQSTFEKKSRGSSHFFAENLFRLDAHFLRRPFLELWVVFEASDFQVSQSVKKINNKSFKRWNESSKKFGCHLAHCRLPPCAIYLPAYLTKLPTYTTHTTYLYYLTK